MYRREMHVLAVGSWWSCAGFTVTVGLGWKPSSLAGSAGLDVQKYTWGREGRVGEGESAWKTLAVRHFV